MMMGWDENGWWSMLKFVEQVVQKGARGELFGGVWCLAQPCRESASPVPGARYDLGCSTRFLTNFEGTIRKSRIRNGVDNWSRLVRRGDGNGRSCVAVKTTRIWTDAPLSPNQPTLLQVPIFCHSFFFPLLHPLTTLVYDSLE